MALLKAGACAGFAAGANDGHQLINRSDRPAVYLEIGNRDADDHVYYSDPDVDLRAPPGGMTRRDGLSNLRQTQTTPGAYTLGGVCAR
jgi:uncharacterized cupin superfamily protein